MPKRARQRGSIRQRGGAYEVRVYAGLDPVTKKPHYLTGTADSPGEAEKLRTKFLGQVDANRRPKNKATVSQLLNEFCEVKVADPSTVERRDDLIRLYIEPTFGKENVGKLSARMLELFYARLQTCKDQCGGRRNGKKGHACQPLSPGTVRKIHYIIRPALNAAVRWGYADINVATLIEPPVAKPAQVDPPTAEEAARLLNKAFQLDLDWGTFLWLAMVLGCRRGELCSIQWTDIDFPTQILNLKFSEQQLRRHGHRRKDTKNHQHRRISFDRDTTVLLTALRVRAEERCAALGIELPETAYLFSTQPDGSEPLILDHVSHRYMRLARSLKLKSTRLHSLRHYSATELVAAGVDLRTVAGRLGHGSGGATTLRVYAAWSPSADERAASILSKRLPMPGRTPDAQATTVNGKSIVCVCGNATTWTMLVVDGERIWANCGMCGARVQAVDPAKLEVRLDPTGDVPQAPYLRIAADLRRQIVDGELTPGAQLPTVKELAALHEVSVPTAHRALAMITKEGLVIVSRGVRAKVRDLKGGFEGHS